MGVHAMEAKFQWSYEKERPRANIYFSEKL